MASSRPLNICFIPFVVPSHVIPIFEVSRLFAARGEHVTIITIPPIAATLRNAVAGNDAAAAAISFHVVHPPPEGRGLEKLHLIDDIECAAKLFIAFTTLRPQIEEFLSSAGPDCIVSDPFYPWTADVAARLRIPRLLFNPYSMFSLCVEDAARHPDSPVWKVGSDDEPFELPGLPDPITMTRSRLPVYLRDPTRGPEGSGGELMRGLREAELNSYCILVNSFDELESAYTEHYKAVLGDRVKIRNIGPVAAQSNSHGERERLYKSDVEEDKCLSWLDSKEPNSVIYVCFGSTCKFQDEQLAEIARALEASRYCFIWGIHGKEEATKEKWLPAGFEERTKERGMLVMGWAPQVLILSHASVGGFLTHCGWNSVTEAVSAGVPVATWPVHSEQFFNEKLVTQVLGIGVEVGSREWEAIGAPKEVIEKGKIEVAVRRLMDGSDEAVKVMRQKAKELAKKAKQAAEEGGSSYNNLTVMIEELKQLRDDQNKRSCVTKRP